MYVTDQAYSIQDILAMETDIAISLGYSLTVPTVHTFLCRFLKAAHADRPMVQLTCYLTERSLQEYSMLKFLPSQIAAAAVWISRTTLKRHPWSPTLLKYTNYDECDIMPCIQEMERVLSNPAANQQQAVCRKYSSTKFGSVAKLPLVFN